MSDDELNSSNNQALIDAIERLAPAEVVSISRGDKDAIELLIVQDGQTVHEVKPFLDQYLPAPERKRGTATLTTLDAFIAHAVRFKDEHSAVFADDNPMLPKLVSVLDYHEPGNGSPRFGDHRGRYDFPMSEAWKEWNKVSGEEMSQRDFAEFIESRITDVVDPKEGGDKLWDFAEGLGILVATRTQLVELSKGLSVNTESKIAEHHNLTSGEARIRFEQTHKGADGSPIVVPGGFGIAIPVFRGDPPYRLAVRLRHRVQRAPIGERDRVFWTVSLYRADAAFADAVQIACAKVIDETGLPLFNGSPE